MIGSTKFLFSSMLGQPFLLCFQQQRNPGFKFVVGVSYANLWLVYEKSLPQHAGQCSSAATTAGLWLSGAKAGSRRTVTTCDSCLLTRPVSSVEVSWLGEHRQAVSCRFGRRLYFRRLGLSPNLHSAKYLKCRLRVFTVYLYSDYVLFY